MKKEYLDYLYVMKFRVAAEIERLSDLNKSPRDGKCEGCGDIIETEMRIRRSQFDSIEASIVRYLELHQF